jgi:hypothetical protein
MGLQSFVFNLILAFMHQSRRGEKKIRPNASAYVLRVQKPKNANLSCFLPQAGRHLNCFTHTYAGDNECSKQSLF